MSYIQLPENIADAPQKSQPLLEAVKEKIGFAPNLYKLISNSPSALEAMLSFNGALGNGSLDARTRERIALTVANVNGCNYCNAAHTVIGTSLKLDTDEIIANREGRSNDPRADAAVKFAHKIASTRGQIIPADIENVRAQGYSDGDLVEIVAHVALNTMTNYVNEVFGTPIDFPTTEPAKRVA